MRPFGYVQATSIASALQAAAPATTSDPMPPPTEALAQFLAGGTTILDLMKLDVMRPQTLVDIGSLRRSANASIDRSETGLRLGAFATMAQAAEHPDVLRDYPLIAETLRLAASAQLRNMATLGGNVLQRTRCAYFRDPRTTACNKRSPGSGCAAIGGINRQHAVLGASDDCVATYPGDLAQALIALDAKVELQGPAGLRTLPFEALHRRPAGQPNVETVLAPGELIVAIQVPAAAHTRRSHYVKIRDRDSYQFALTSAAVALDLQGGVVRAARIALGGVATVPWRSREAEAALVGRHLDEQTAAVAADAAFEAAKPLRHNAYKVTLGKRTLIRALLETGRIPA